MILIVTAIARPKMTPAASKNMAVSIYRTAPFSFPVSSVFESVCWGSTPRISVKAIWANSQPLTNPTMPYRNAMIIKLMIDIFDSLR